MANGDAAEASAPMTELTLPCISTGTTVCVIVCIETLAIGRQKAIIDALAAMNQNNPVGVSAIRA